MNSELIAIRQDDVILAALEQGELIQLLRCYQSVFTDEDFFLHAEKLKSVVRRYPNDMLEAEREFFFQMIHQTISMINERQDKRSIFH